MVVLITILLIFVAKASDVANTVLDGTDCVADCPYVLNKATMFVKLAKLCLKCF